MEQRKIPKFNQHSKRYKKVTLSFSERELCGLYTFFVPKVHLGPFKKLVVEAGGYLEKETPEYLHYIFEGEKAVLKVHNLAIPHMYRY